jgi:hypothetical protein
MRACFSGVGSVFLRWSIRPLPLSRLSFGTGFGVVGGGVSAVLENGYEAGVAAALLGADDDMRRVKRVAIRLAMVEDTALVSVEN